MTRQLVDRLAPWAPLTLLLGIVASLVEAAEERDISSTILLTVSLAAALVILRIKRGLTRGEVRAEVAAGVRALVVPEAQIRQGRVTQRLYPTSPPPGSTLTEATTDPTWPEEESPL